MNEKQFKRLRKLWHQNKLKYYHMMYAAYGPAKHMSERNAKRIRTLDHQVPRKLRHLLE